MLFITPRFIKEAKHYLHGAKKFLSYKRDILPKDQADKVEKRIAELTAAMKSRSSDSVQKAIRELDTLIGKISPPPKDAGWRENVEVFLVAIVVAAGIKAFILQPFRIPTGSMQPTLFGIVGTPTATPPPNLLVRAFEFVWLGRHYIDLKASESDVVMGLKERTYANFFTFTEIVCRNRSYTLFVPRDPLARYFNVRPGREYQAGDTIARGSRDGIATLHQTPGGNAWADAEDRSPSAFRGWEGAAAICLPARDERKGRLQRIFQRARRIGQFHLPGIPDRNV